MGDNFSKTLYFAVGFFSTAQREQRDRDLLAAAGSSSTLSTPAPRIETVHITVFHVNTGTQNLDLGIEKVPGSLSGSHFEIERFGVDWPPKGQSPSQAFSMFLQSDTGKAQFGSATAVQLFSTNLHIEPA